MKEHKERFEFWWDVVKFVISIIAAVILGNLFVYPHLPEVGVFINLVIILGLIQIGEWVFWALAASFAGIAWIVMQVLDN